MKFRKVFLFITLVVGLLFISSETVLACPCKGYQSIEDNFNNVDIVFVGTVVDIVEQVEPTTLLDRDTPYLEIHFSVHRSWKGVDTREAIVYTFKAEELCGFTFELNETYLVYGDSEWRTDNCSGTKEYYNAQEDIEYLNNISEIDFEEDSKKTFLLIVMSLCLVVFIFCILYMYCIFYM